MGSEAVVKDGVVVTYHLHSDEICYPNPKLFAGDEYWNVNVVHGVPPL